MRLPLKLQAAAFIFGALHVLLMCPCQADL